MKKSVTIYAWEPEEARKFHSVELCASSNAWGLGCHLLKWSNGLDIQIHVLCVHLYISIDLNRSVYDDQSIVNRPEGDF